MLPHVFSQAWFDGPVKNSLRIRPNLDTFIESHQQPERLSTSVHSVSCLWPQPCAAARQTVSSQHFVQTGFMNSVRVNQWRGSSPQVHLQAAETLLRHQMLGNYSQSKTASPIFNHSLMRFYFSSIQMHSNDSSRSPCVILNWLPLPLIVFQQ